MTATNALFWGSIALAVLILTSAVINFFAFRKPRASHASTEADALAEVSAKNNPKNDEQIRERNAKWAHEQKQEELRKLEIQRNDELWRARECYRQCKEEKQDALDKLAAEQERAQEAEKRWDEEKRDYANMCLEYRAKIGELTDKRQELESQLAPLQDLEGLLGPLSQLQIDALRFRKRLQRFISETGSEPVCETPQRGDDLERDIAARTLAGLNFETKMRSFTNLLDSTYQVQLRTDAVTLYWKFVQGGMPDDPHFGSLLETPHTVERLKELDSLLWTKIGMLQ